jgi:hypothetical protein
MSSGASNPLQPAGTPAPGPDPLLVTAGNLAAKLGISRQAVHKQLAGIPSCAKARFKGQTVAAWAVAALPESLRRRLAVARQQRGFRTDADFLASDVEPWQPPRPFNELPPAARAEAVQWREILAPLLTHQHTLSPADFLDRGLAAARQILGRAISDDTLRRRFALASERDRGFAQWTRLELYVAEAAYQASQRNPDAAGATAVVAPPSDLWPDLADRLAELENQAQPTAEDRAHLLDAAFRQLEAMAAANPGRWRESQLKHRLGELLWQAVPALGRTRAAFRRNFDRKLNAWRAGGKTVAAITDRRDHSGPRAAKLCPACRELVKGAAVELDGDLTQAWRRLILPPDLGGIPADGKGLCNACAGRWHYDVRRNKSYLPASVRGDLWPEIEPCLVHRHGPKTAKLASPYIRRDWSDIGPGNYFVADDQTPNHLLWEQLDDGRFYVGRPECLLMTDERTDYPIGYELRLGTVDELGRQTAAHYGSREVRILVLHCNDRIGLPHVGYTFENGPWAARLIDGEAVHGWELNPWRRVEHGLRDPRLGLTVRHADPGNPRTKPIERVFGMTQHRMRPQAGFVGFDERRDRREATQNFLNRVRAGKEHPGNELHSLAAFIQLLDEELMAFAREPQNGQRLPGVSPMEAWLNGIGGKPGIASRPLRKLEACDRALLATHRRRAHVGSQGIRLRLGGLARVFWSDALIPYRHRDLTVAMNLEEPELLHCLPENAAPFTVREMVLPSKTATPDQLAAASAARRRWVKAGKVAFDNLPHPLRTSITRDSVDPAVRAEGDYINAATAAHRETQRQERRQSQRIEKLANTLNAVVTVNPKRAAEQEAALARMRQRALAAAAAVPPAQ